MIAPPRAPRTGVARLGSEHDTYVVLQDIELSMAFDTGRYHMFTLVALRDVGLQSERGATFGLHHGYRLLRPLELPVDADHARPFSCEQNRCNLADARPARAERR